MHKFAGLTWGILGTCVVALSGVQASELQKPTAACFTSETLSQPIATGEIEVRATVDKSIFHEGESIRFTITATNTCDTTRELTFPTGQNFDIAVSPLDTKTPAWTWSHHMAFTMVVREVEIKPGQSLTFHATWNQQDDNGKPMPRGIYDVRCKLTSLKNGIDAPVVKLTLTK